MHPLCLYCKSWLPDLGRVERLARSVERHNTQALPFYVSCPAKEPSCSASFM